MKIEETTIPVRHNKGTRSRSPLSSILTLASWSFRQPCWQLVLTGLALLGVITVACVVPLFAAVADNASLQGTFNATPLRSTFALDTKTQGLSTAVVQKMNQLFDPLIRSPFGAYLESSQPSLVMQLSNVGIRQPDVLGSGASLTLYSTSLQRLQPDLRLVQGNWPSNVPGAFDIMMTAETASALHLSVGTQITLAGAFTTNPKNMQRGAVDRSPVLHARLVGTFEAAQENPPSFFSENFQPAVGQLGVNYTFLVPANALLAVADQCAIRGHVYP